MERRMNSICRSIYFAVCQAANPRAILEKNVHISGGYLTVFSENFLIEKGLYLVAMGKAAFGMVQAVEKAIGDHLVRGIASVPIGTKAAHSGSELANLKTEIYEGAMNNQPDEAALKTALRVRTLSTSLTAGDILLVLISGGGSALLPLPATGVSLDEKLATIRLLANGGATIEELNIVRQNLSQLKGGRLAEIARPAMTIGLILSDIVSSPLPLIASGPTVPQTSTKRDALNILLKYSAEKDLPSSVANYLRNTPEIVEKAPNVCNIVVCDNRIAMTTTASTNQNTNIALIRCDLTGDATEIGRRFARFLKTWMDGHSIVDALIENQLLERDQNCIKSPHNWTSDRLCLLFGGETTVCIQGSGLGGWNLSRIRR